MAITLQKDMSYEREQKGTERRYSRNGSRIRAYSTPIDAKYSSTYSYHVEGASLLRTKITPLPPNQLMQRLLDMKADAIKLSFEIQLKQAELVLEKAREDMEKTLEQEEAGVTD